MKKRAASILKLTWRLVTAVLASVRAFFTKLRNVDVDEVGQSVFKHCTSPKALYVTLFERWWIVCVCAFFGACLGVYMIVSAVEKYSSHGSLLIYQKMPTFMDDKMMVPDPKAYDSLFATHVQLMGSPMIVDRAIEHFKLEETCPGISDELDEETNFEQYVRKNLKVGRAGSGDSAGAFVVTVGFGHTKAKECGHVVDAVMDTYKEYVNDSLLFDQRKAVDLVRRTKAQLEQEVNERNEKYRAFLKSAPGVWNKLTENNPHQERVEQLAKELTDLEIKQVSLTSRARIMSQTHDLVTGEPLTDIARVALIDEEHMSRFQVIAGIKKEQLVHEAQADYPELQEFESARFDKLLAMYGERAEMLGNLGSDHPDIKDLNASIVDVEARVKELHQLSEKKDVSATDLVDAYIRMLTKELTDVEVKIDFVKRRIDEEVKQSHELTDFTVQAKHLESEYQRSLEMYQTVMDNSTKQNLLDEYGNFIAEVVARPHHAELTWPKKPVLLALCTILGIFLGSFIALALDLIAHTPLRSVFWFFPRWILGGNTPKNIKAQLPAGENG